MRLLWALSSNRKTGSIPTAYVGTTKTETRASCKGCSLGPEAKGPQANSCYAWRGLNMAKFLGHHSPRFQREPERYDLLAVLEKIPARVLKTVKVVRMAALGDPARADRKEFWSAVALAKKWHLSVLAYTHFWREAGNQELKQTVMASCDRLDEADDAIRKGWTPAVVLPFDESKAVGHAVTTPDGNRILVCPAQTKPAKVTCNTCRMCDPSHQVFRGGKVQGIGFVEH